jgi:hypothetical protein
MSLEKALFSFKKIQNENMVAVRKYSVVSIAIKVSNETMDVAVGLCMRK